MLVNDVNDNNETEMDPLIISAVKEVVNDNTNIYTEQKLNVNVSDVVQNEIKQMGINKNNNENEKTRNSNCINTYLHIELMNDRNKQFQEKCNETINNINCNKIKGS